MDLCKQEINTLDFQKQRLNQLIELVANQEAKLNRLKTLRKLAKEQTVINLKISNELATVNSSIAEKDEELKQALNIVDKLNRQLTNYRNSRSYRNSKNVALNKQKLLISPAGSEQQQQQQQDTINDKKQSINDSRRVSFDPLALLLDASLEGELDLVIKTSKQVADLNASNDESVTALHNAVVAGHYDVAKYLIEAGCDVNVQDSDGWTPLHCAASCNNLQLVKLLIENNASVFATTTSDSSTPDMKCDENEEGFEECYNYLISVQNNLGVINDRIVYCLYDYQAQKEDELSFVKGDELEILRKDDSEELAWWWAKKRKKEETTDTVIDIEEGYIPRNLVGLKPISTQR